MLCWDALFDFPFNRKNITSFLPVAVYRNGFGKDSRSAGRIVSDFYITAFPGAIGSLVHSGVVHPQEAITRVRTSGASPVLSILNV